MYSYNSSGFMRTIIIIALPSSVTFMNQSYVSIQIPNVRHSGAFADWLKFVAAVTYNFCILLFYFLCSCHAMSRTSAETAYSL